MFYKWYRLVIYFYNQVGSRTHEGIIILSKYTFWLIEWLFGQHYYQIMKSWKDTIRGWIFLDIKHIYVQVIYVMITRNLLPQRKHECTMNFDIVNDGGLYLFSVLITQCHRPTYILLGCSYTISSKRFYFQQYFYCS